jgi:hypothetical protein
MSLTDLIPPVYRVWLLGLALAALAAVSFGTAWKVQAWRYDAQLAAQATQHAEAETARMGLVLSDLRSAKEKSRVVTQALQINDETHHKELTSVQSRQAVLADRLATSDLRLSVLLATGVSQSAGGERVPAATDPGGVVHGSPRAELDPAHAQRIIRITGDGDEGLTALAACQGYVREIWQSGQGQNLP